MNVKHYQWAKRGVATLVLVGGLLAFADVWHGLGARFTDVVFRLQFMPALLGAAQGMAAALVVLAGIVLLTLLFGRVYCAMLCPLGVCMDVAAKLAGRTGKKRKLPYKKGRLVVRVGVLAVVAGAWFWGSAAWLGLFDPYSIFGRMVAAIVRPATGWVVNRLAVAGVGSPAQISPVDWAVVGVGAGFLLLVGWVAVARGRLWCNSVCPVGTLLGFVSRFSVFRLQIKATECVGCAICEKVCPAQCIDYREHKIDHSRCVMCLECVAQCRKSGIEMVNAWAKGPVSEGAPVVAGAVGEAAAGAVSGAAPKAYEIGRRGFLAAGVAVAEAAGHGRGQGGEGHGRRHRGGGEGGGGEGGCACGGKGDGLTQRNKLPVLPPGAVERGRFHDLCTACHLCVVHCPEQVLRPSVWQHGMKGFLQPFMDFDVSFCSYECKNCGDVCPTGAILPMTLPERKQVQAGVARFFRHRCVVWRDGTSCGACSEHCPTQAVHMVKFRGNLTIPVVDPELCIGCGGCEFICPVRPDKAIVVTGVEKHGRIRKIEEGKANTERAKEEEFPF